MFHKFGIGSYEFSSCSKKVVFVDFRSIVVSKKVIGQWDRGAQALQATIQKTGVSKISQADYSHRNVLIVFTYFCLGQIVHDYIMDMAVGRSSGPWGVWNILVHIFVIFARAENGLSMSIDAGADS